jgi:hypothetical protein
MARNPVHEVGICSINFKEKKKTELRMYKQKQFKKMQ